MREIKPKPPCTQNCEKRKPGCRAECEPFVKYDRARLEWYAKRQEEKERQRKLHTERTKR